MTLKDIDYILEVTQTQNFNKAAENLYTAQPTLSYHIKAVEDELGFQIFARSGRSAVLTPAGSQFCVTLRNVRAELKSAIEQAQNFNTKYMEAILVGLPTRSFIYYLPQSIKAFEQRHPSVSASPVFSYDYSTEQFLKEETDIVFAQKESVKRIPDIQIYPFYESPIYLISQPDNPLAKKELVITEDLRGRSLMVGGSSPPALIKVQQRGIRMTGINYFNSADHDTTLTNVAADKEICLAPPGFLNDHNPEFAWTPFDCEGKISCVLCTHKDDTRTIVRELVNLMRERYQTLL